MYNREKAVATHSSTLAWKIPWTEEPGRLQSMGSLESDTTERLHFQFSLSCIGERNGNPLQCSCLENPRDGRAWWAAVYGVTQSWTRLKRLSTGYNQLTLLIMNHGCNPIVSPFNTFQARFKELGDVDLSSTLKVYKIFTKVGQGSWLRGNSALGPPV